MKKWLIICFVCFIYFIPINVNAKTKNNFDEIHTKIKITKDSKIYVTETGQVNGIGNHTIVRKLPFYFVNQMNEKRLAKISQIEGSAMSFRYSNFGDSMYLRAKVNDNKNSYTISYVYDFSSVGGVENTLYIPLIKSSDYENIDSYTFDIELENTESLEQFQWLMDDEIISDSQLNYSVIGNHITGKLLIPLHSTTITSMIKVPENYFYQTHNNYHTNAILFFIATGLVLIAAFILYLLAKRQVKKPPIVKFPPANLSPAEIGYIYKGVVGDKEVLSYLINYAIKGNMKIAEYSQKNNKITSWFVKQESLNSKDEIESYIYHQLFVNRDKVEIQALKGKFYKKLEYAKKQLSYRTLEDKIYDKKSYLLLYLIYGLTLFMFLSLQLCFCFSVLGSLFDSIICVLLSFFAILCLLFTVKHEVPYLKKVAYSIVLVPLFIMVIYSFICLRYNWFYVCCIGMMLIMLFLGKEIQKRFKEHSYIVRKIDGFRRYLKEKSAKSEEQFYDYLPYAYVLGVSKQWIRHNEKVNLPSWLDVNLKSTSFIQCFEYYMETINSILFSLPQEHLPKLRYKKKTVKNKNIKNFAEETKKADESFKKQKEKKT